MDPALLFTFRSSSSITRGHRFKIFKPHATCLPRHHLFSLRVINYWNELPEDVVNADSTDLFTTYLDGLHDDHQFDIV